MEICYGHSFSIYFLVSNMFIFVLNKHVKQFIIMKNMTQQEYQTTSTVITISDGRVLPSKYVLGFEDQLEESASKHFCYRHIANLNMD